MKKIPLTHGEFALVDDGDFEKINRYKWYANRKTPEGQLHARRKNKGNTIYMHRVVMGAESGQYVDHINHKELDNRKSNLRICTCSQNLMNARKAKNKSSEYKGISWHKRDKRWQVNICKNNVKYFLDQIKKKKT